MISKSFAESLNGVIFPRKLWLLASSDEVSSVRWARNGTSVEIDSLLLGEECFTPSVFNVKSNQSVLRQLSYYQFEKLDRRSRLWEFKHPYFQAEKEELVILIKRLPQKLPKKYACDVERRSSSRIQSLASRRKTDVIYKKEEPGRKLEKITTIKIRLEEEKRDPTEVIRAPSERQDLQNSKYQCSHTGPFKDRNAELYPRSHCSSSRSPDKSYHLQDGSVSPQEQFPKVKRSRKVATRGRKKGASKRGRPRKSAQSIGILGNASSLSKKRAFSLKYDTNNFHSSTASLEAMRTNFHSKILADADNVSSWTSGKQTSETKVNKHIARNNVNQSLTAASHFKTNFKSQVSDEASEHFVDDASTYNAVDTNEKFGSIPYFINSDRLSIDCNHTFDDAMENDNSKTTIHSKELSQSSENTRLSNTMTVPKNVTNESKYHVISYVNKEADNCLNSNNTDEILQGNFADTNNNSSNYDIHHRKIIRPGVHSNTENGFFHFTDYVSHGASPHFQEVQQKVSPCLITDRDEIHFGTQSSRNQESEPDSISECMPLHSSYHKLSPNQNAVLSILPGVENIPYSPSNNMSSDFNINNFPLAELKGSHKNNDNLIYDSMSIDSFYNGRKSGTPGMEHNQRSWNSNLSSNPLLYTDIQQNYPRLYIQEDSLTSQSSVHTDHNYSLRNQIEVNETSPRVIREITPEISKHPDFSECQSQRGLSDTFEHFDTTPFSDGDYSFISNCNFIGEKCNQTDVSKVNQVGQYMHFGPGFQPNSTAISSRAPEFAMSRFDFIRNDLTNLIHKCAPENCGLRDNSDLMIVEERDYLGDHHQSSTIVDSFCHNFSSSAIHGNYQENATSSADENHFGISSHDISRLENKPLIFIDFLNHQSKNMKLYSWDFLNVTDIVVRDCSTDFCNWNSSKFNSHFKKVS